MSGITENLAASHASYLKRVGAPLGHKRRVSLLAALLLHGAAVAQEFPTKPLRIVTSQAGGGIRQAARDEARLHVVAATGL